MKILIYKRTHVGDPNMEGEFDNEGCMGKVRGFAFDAVIGVGGISRQPKQQGLSGKINWVGRRPRRTSNPIDCRGPLVSFKKLDFKLFEQNGPFLAALAPNLSRKIYGSRARFFFTSLTCAEEKEALSIIDSALNKGEFDHLQIAEEVTNLDHHKCMRKQCRTKPLVEAAQRRCLGSRNVRRSGRMK